VTATPPEGFRQHRFVAPPGATTVLLVRHGESAPAVPGAPFPLRDGHGDPPLDPVGVEQAELLGERLRHERVDAIYVTSLRRTHETAAPLAPTPASSRSKSRTCGGVPRRLGGR
jgi:probable phosphoglycerate mutase